MPSREPSGFRDPVPRPASGNRLTRGRRVSWRRLLVAGLLAAAGAAVIGVSLERARFGASHAAGLARAHAEIDGRFQRMTALLGDLGSAIASDARTGVALEAARAQHPTRDSTRALFDIVDGRLGPARGRAAVAVTIYGMPNAIARAWAGRPSDIPIERIRSPQAWFVTPSPQGLRLVHVVPVTSDGNTLGVVVAEHAISTAPRLATIAPADYLLPTRLGPAAILLPYEGAGEQARENAFVLRSPAGEILVEATILPEHMDEAQEAWRRRVAAWVIATIAITILLLVGPSLDRRAAARSAGTVRRSTIVVAGLTVACAGLVWVALDTAFDGGPGRPALVLVCGGALAGLAALSAAPLAGLRAAARRRRREPGRAALRFSIEQLLSGLVLAAILALFAWVLRGTLEGANVDLRYFSLHPWGGERLTLLGAVLAAHVAALWGATLVLVASSATWRVSRRRRMAASAAWLLWTAPALAAAAVALAKGWPLPPLGVVLSALACATAALLAPDAARWFRHATVGARIVSLFVAFWIPSLLLYPSVSFFTERTVRTVIEEEYAVEAQNHPLRLQERMAEAREEIDAVAGLPDLVVAPPCARPDRCPERAFFVWKQTALARHRLTSAVELYNADGALVSRFALNFPEYTGTIQTPKPTSCEWEVFGEATRFGSEERRMLHAEKSVCVRASEDDVDVLGAIVLHAVPDYRTLPFIESESPYFEVFRSTGDAHIEGATGSEVEIVIYGWGLTPLYASGGTAWPITDALFDRIYRSREPLWTKLDGANGHWHVLFSNDRNGIYALGYPGLTLFDRFVHLAELTTMAGAAYVVILLATAIFTRVAREQPRVGRALLREIRASFYRKLFLAFVLASIIPVVALALVIRAYFEGLLRADVEAQAARSASVAQRVIEESDALQRRGIDPLPPASDDVMIWISQVIDQDVNIFAGADLVATSERDLFASGLLPTRTPDGVYRAIVLDRLPSYVQEDRIGDFPYMIAATRVRVAGSDLVLTVPLANQQREIEREVDELDRGVHLAALFFILLGAAMGLSMAERIADPVRRLTRATRRIASGDFDARIAVKSADELRRLVDAFNSMASELKAQRVQLERTHRLEAWAEMARQVAHEIKNPLTPIQLSAEHLRRVHADRGAPMGAVLDTCIASILGQVRLLRQISSEFSSFASSPTARPAFVDLPELVAEVMDPYRTGLEDRILVQNDVAPPLPPVFVDRHLVARALVNVVENALHAMPGRGTLTLHAAEEPGSVVLQVRDTGAGMDEEALARVFEPYFSTKASGTGLGLPIARRNVELSGGAIEVESAKGQGTLVVLRLPTSVRDTPPQA